MSGCPGVRPRLARCDDACRLANADDARRRLLRAVRPRSRPALHHRRRRDRRRQPGMAAAGGQRGRRFTALARGPVTRVQPDETLSADVGLQMDAISLHDGVHRLDWTHCRADGTPFPVRVTLRSTTFAGRPALIAVWHDLTETRRREAELTRAHVALAAELDQAAASSGCCCRGLCPTCRHCGWQPTIEPATSPAAITTTCSTSTTAAGACSSPT